MTEYLTTRELAALLRIKERKVYDLVASGAVPCSRATGKLLFPRKAIDDWLASNVSQPAALAPRPQVILGSHDPLLEWALRASQCGLATYFDSSLDGIERFANGEGIAAGMHLYDVESDSWNNVRVDSHFATARVVLAEWAKRSRGIIVAPGAEQAYTGLADLAGKTMVPRQPGAGSQILLEALLRRQQVDTNDIDWAPQARSEVDAVVEVVEGRADATFGLAMLAGQHRLGFVPVIDERFDILVDRRAWFEPTWQALIRFCQTPAFREHARVLAGYDIGDQFRIHFNGAE
ncbi:MAG: helix-turn-helix transcriptional regulator [Gammaproteobacteria bacterium]|nr:helix-turn-helix transcriptional regulator [Gammaproteobacteria bacterium]MDH3447612.1 helix-turn-helix transcriptional regulator [Gammaproteobacteria bacterium]